MASPTFSASLEDPASTSQILMVKSPEADARTFSAAGLKRTWPTLLQTGSVSAPYSGIPSAYRGCPDNLEMGATSWMSSGLRAECTVKSLGTFQRKTLPSSEPEAMRESSKGCLSYLAFQRPRAYRSEDAYQSVSSTTAVCPLNSGIFSGTLPVSSTGMTANAPPPLASQLTAMYSGFAYLGQKTW